MRSLNRQQKDYWVKSPHSRHMPIFLKLIRMQHNRETIWFISNVYDLELMTKALLRIRWFVKDIRHCYRRLKSERCTFSGQSVRLTPILLFLIGCACGTLHYLVRVIGWKFQLDFGLLWTHYWEATKIGVVSQRARNATSASASLTGRISDRSEWGPLCYAMQLCVELKLYLGWPYLSGVIAGHPKILWNLTTVVLRYTSRDPQRACRRKEEAIDVDLWFLTIWARMLWIETNSPWR